MVFWVSDLDLSTWFKMQANMAALRLVNRWSSNPEDDARTLYEYYIYRGMHDAAAYWLGNEWRIEHGY